MNCSNAAHSHIISGVEAGAPECGTGGGEQPAVLLWHDVGKEIHPNISLPEERRLFDRFYTMGAGRNATGLGVSIAKPLTKRMGGQIEAAFEAGQLHFILKL